jgi:hypothetical protein
MTAEVCLNPQGLSENIQTFVAKKKQRYGFVRIKNSRLKKN